MLLKLMRFSRAQCYLIFAFASTLCCFAQSSVTLALSSGSGSPGSIVTLNMSSNGTAQAAALEWTLIYSPADFSSIAVGAAPIAIAANKSVSCDNNVPGISNCVLWGLNATTVPNGVIASVSLGLSSTTTNTSSAIQFSSAGAANGAGASLSALGNGTAVIIQQQPHLNGFTCTPVSLTPPAASSCRVALSAPALAPGTTVTISSTSAAASVPPTVTVPTGATSTTFNATAGNVSVSTSVTLTASYLGVSETFGLVINPTTPASGTAAFVKTDATTAGSWKGVYGADGFNVINDTTSYPSYVNVSPSGMSDYIWASSTVDLRGLQKAAATDRIAACWYSGSAFTVDLSFKDTATHQVAVYLLDWDRLGRTQRVDILDANNNVLDTRSAAGYSGGEYLVWKLSGHVILRFVNTTASFNAVLSGLFFR